VNHHNIIDSKLGPLANLIKGEALRTTCLTLLLDYPRLALAPAALKWHHDYEGGLLAHTEEVTSIALKAASASPCDIDILIAAALWHDLAKVWEYELHFGEEADVPEKALVIGPDGVTGQIRYWTTGEYYKRVYHIQGSMAEFYRQAFRYEVDPATIDAVCHCILAHHGPVKDWGSPVAPQSLEALILHHADMVSAKFGPTMRKP
jgi:3'-5' exoribonuclease